MLLPSTSFIIKIAFIISFFIFFNANSLHSTPKDNRISFSYQLYKEKDYYRSLSELLKIGFFYENTDKIKYLTALNLYKLNEYEKLNTLKLSDIGTFSNLQSDILSLQSLAHLKNRRIRHAQFLWEKAMKKDFFVLNKTEFLNEKTANSYNYFLPGSGYFYTNEYLKGTLALFLQALTLYFTFHSYQNKEYGITLLSFFTGYQLYQGIQRGTSESIQKHNEKVFIRQSTPWIQKAEQQLTPPEIIFE